MWLENSLLNRTRLSGFILLSLGIHFIVVVVNMVTPAREEKIKGPPRPDRADVERKKQPPPISKKSVHL